MAEISSLIVKLKSEGASQLNADLKNVKAHGAGAESSVKSLTSTVGKLAAAAGGVLSVSAAFSKLVETGRETGILNTQLQTATGSAENAKAAFAALQKLTTELPTDLAETTKAFVTLVNRGLNPSREAIISYANTAAANGKSLDQFIEAIADATTFEFERLKEFGIKSKQIGDDVQFTFRGQTTTIKKSSEEIEKYLQRIGNVDFAGAATKQMATLDGQISNLGVAWDGLFRTINDQGAGGLISEGVVLATEAIQTLTDLIGSGALQERIANIGLAFSDAFDLHDNAEAALKTYGGSLDGMESATEETVKFIIDAFKGWPENVAALVKIVAVELGYLVDIAALKAEDIADAMNPKNWINSGDLEEVNDKLAQAIASRDRLLSSGLNDSIPVVKALNKQIEELTAEQTKLNAELEQHESRYKAVDQARNDSIAAILAERDAEQGAAADRAKHADQALKDYKAQQAAAKSLNDVIADIPKTIRQQSEANKRLIESLKEEYRMMQLSDKERQVQIQLKKLSADATQAERDQVRGLVEQTYDLEEANKAAAKHAKGSSDEYAKAWEKAVGRIDEAFAGAWEGAFDSFESFTDSILDGFNSLVGEIAHIQFTKPLTDALRNGITGQGGGMEFSSLFGSVGSTFGQLFGGGGSEATTMGKGGQAVAGPDAALGQTGFLSQYGSSIGMIGGALLGNSMGGKYGSVGSSLGSMAGAAFFGPLGGLLGGLAGGALGGLFGGEESDKWQGASVNLSTGRITTQGETGDKFSQENRSAADSAAGLIAQLADAIAEQTGRRLTDEIKIGVGSRDGVDFAVNGKDIVTDQGDLSKVMDSIFEYMLTSAGLVSDVYRDLQMDGENLVSAMIRVEAQFSAVTEITKNLELNFGLVGDTGKAAADAIVQMAGGLDAFVQKSDYYYNNFYSEQERLEKSIENYSAALADFNSSMGTSIYDRGGLREFVDALDLTTQAGQEAYAAALNLAPSLVDLGAAQARLAEITQTAKRELVAMDDVSDMTVNKVAAVTEEMKKLTEQADAFAGGLSRDALLEGLNGYDRDIFLLEEWKTKAVEQLQAFTDQGVAILGGPETVLANIEKIYGIRLGEINERYTDSVHIVDEYIVATEDLGESISNVIDLSDYLAELERQRADAINDVMSAYERESKVFETTADKFSRFADTLRDFDKELLTGDLSTLNPAAQYSESRSQFSELAQRAQAGDESAISQLTGAANSFLTESRSFQGSAGNYARDFDFVRQTLANTISTSEKQASNAEQQLAQLKAQVSEIVSLKAEVKTLQEAIAALVQVEREAGNAMIQQQQQTNQTLNGLKSNSDLQRAAS